MVKYELQKLFTNKLLIPVITAILFSWIFIASNTHTNSPSYVLIKSFTFWQYLGSFAVGFIILMITTKIFSMDAEQRVEDLFHTTKHGKRQLFFTRLRASMLFTIVIVLLFIGIQLGGILSFITTEQIVTNAYDLNITIYFILQAFTVLIGAVLLTLFAAVICTIFKSHPITLIVCGLFYGMSYIIRTSIVSKYSSLWLLDKGFFSYLISGKLFRTPPIDWMEFSLLAVWYGILSAVVMIVNTNLQRRRKEY